MQALDQINEQISDVQTEIDRCNAEYQNLLRDLAGSPTPDMRAKAVHAERQMASHQADLQVLRGARASIEAEAKSERAQQRRKAAKRMLTEAADLHGKHVQAAEKLDKALDALAAAIEEYAEAGTELGAKVRSFYATAVPSLQMRGSLFYGIDADSLRAGNPAVAWALLELLLPLNIQANVAIGGITTQHGVKPCVASDVDRFDAGLLTNMEAIALREGISEVAP